MRWAEGFIAVDWGTTNRRAYLIDSAGKQTDEFEDDKGIFSVPQGGFPDAIAEIRDRLGDKPLLLAGMVGSNRGWKEAPYVPCPAGIDDLAQALVWAGEREAIVPGVSYVGHGRADVMRGEEVQLLGAVAAGLVDPDALVCHPGTHNKWTRAPPGQDPELPHGHDGRAVQPFEGAQHSRRPARRRRSTRTTSFKRGGPPRDVQRIASRRAVRIARSVLLGQMKKEDAASYISGLLIGTDVRIGLTDADRRAVDVMGRPDLTRFMPRRSRKRGARRSSSTVNNVSSPAFMRSRKGSDVSAKELLHPLSRTNVR